MIDIQITFPDHTSKDAIFLLLMLKGHILNKENFPRITGMFDAPPRSWRLQKIGIPIHVEKHLVKNYTNPIGFYSMRSTEIRELNEAMGKDRVAAFMERVVEHWDFSEDVKKGLQSKPQPLQSILAGKLLNGGDV